jgi:hypothetical protein
VETQVLTKLLGDCKVMPTADDLCEYGISRRWFFTVEEMKGVIDEPILKSNWYYVPIDPHSTTFDLHPEARRRLTEVLARFPVMQVIYGEEVETEPAKPAISPIRSTVESLKPMVKPAIGLALGTIAVVGGVLLMSMITAMAAVDPKIIVVTGDGKWVCLFSWEKS